MALGPVTQFSGREAAAPVQALAQCVAQAFEAYNGWCWLMGDYAGDACSMWLLQRQITGILSSTASTAFAIPIGCDGNTVGMAAVAFLIRCPSPLPAAPPQKSLVEMATLAWNLGPRIALRLTEFEAAVTQLQAQDAGDVGEHCKISFVGVLPHMRGRGLASQVMKAMLAAVDAEGLPCYLFTANDRNEEMYKKLGFTTRSQRSMGASAAGPSAGEETVIRSMLRPAATSSPPPIN